MTVDKAKAARDKAKAARDAARDAARKLRIETEAAWVRSETERGYKALYLVGPYASDVAKHLGLTHIVAGAATANEMQAAADAVTAGEVRVVTCAHGKEGMLDRFPIALRKALRMIDLRGGTQRVYATEEDGNAQPLMSRAGAKNAVLCFSWNVSPKIVCAEVPVRAVNDLLDEGWRKEPYRNVLRGEVLDVSQCDAISDRIVRLGGRVAIRVFHSGVIVTATFPSEAAASRMLAEQSGVEWA